MDALINSLPQNNTSETFQICVMRKNNEGNECTKSQVAKIRAKGWTPMYYNGSEFVEYEGSEEVIKGDANGDSTVNAADIVEIVNIIIGITSEINNKKGADVNGDGIVNAADIVAIVNIIMGN